MKKNICTSQGDHSPNSHPHKPSPQLLGACDEPQASQDLLGKHMRSWTRAQCWKRIHGQGRGSLKLSPAPWWVQPARHRVLLQRGTSLPPASATASASPGPELLLLSGVCGLGPCLEFWGFPQELLRQPATPSLLAQGDSSLRWSRFSGKL